MQQVHEWFLHRGLPLVLTRRVRSGSLIERSAPMVSALGAIVALTMLLANLTGGDVDVRYVLRLVVLTALLVAAPFGLHLLHRIGTTLSEAGRRTSALIVMALFVFGLPFADSGFSGIAAAEAAAFALVALLAVWLTYLGIGSIVLWAFRFAWVQLGALGNLMSRALPLLMLTVVVYFTGELWQLAARMTAATTLGDNRFPRRGGVAVHGVDGARRDQGGAGGPRRTSRPRQAAGRHSPGPGGARRRAAHPAVGG